MSEEENMCVGTAIWPSAWCSLLDEKDKVTFFFFFRRIIVNGCIISLEKCVTRPWSKIGLSSLKSQAGKIGDG